MSDRCRKIEDLILSENLQGIGDVEQASLENHIAECPACREFRMALNGDDLRLSAFVGAMDEGIAGLENRIMENVSTMEPAPTPRPRSVKVFFSSGRTRLALAAALLLCLVLGIDFLDRDRTGGMVWAEVLARIEEAEDFICRRIEKRTGEPAQEIVEYRSARYGLRQEIYHGDRLQATQFVIPSEKMLYALVHRDKTYMQMHLTEEQVAEHRRQSNAREMVRSFREEDFRSLGHRRVDGRMAEGIEITDPPEWKEVFESGTWRLWVDIETQWPIRIELEGTAAGGSIRKTYTLKDFQWNAELSARDFEVVIPRDYEKIADVEKLDPTEDGAIAGLRAFANLMDGQYPSVLSISTAIAEAEKHLKGKHGSYDEAAGRDVEIVFSVRNACRFYRDLVTEDKDPAYFGESVDARDFDRVLWRWRMNDGRYRVIFGDLRTETIDADDLELLERGYR